MIGIPSQLKQWAKAFPDSIFAQCQDFAMIVDPSDQNIAKHLRNNGIWEPKASELVRKEVKHGDVFVDAGAHWGYYTCLAANVVGGGGRVYSFEANPYAFRYLSLNIILNRFRNVDVFPLGLWESSIPLALDFPTFDNTGGSNVGPAKSDTAPRDKIQSITLDELFVSSEIDFIKVDCEGHDQEVLKGAREILTRGHAKVLAEKPEEVLKEFGYTYEFDAGDGMGPLSFWTKHA